MPPHEKPTMKERILETADRLFYLQGIRAVGVDTIAAEIGISKRTLYNHFPSKDELIAAYLERRFTKAPASDKPPVEQILGTFDRIERGFAAKGFRGCPFVNAVAELGKLAKQPNMAPLVKKALVDRVSIDRDVDVREAMLGLLEATIKENYLGRAEVANVFKIPKVGAVAGCRVTDGMFKRDSEVRVMRDGVQVYKGRLASLKRFKDDASEVRNGMECGISIQNFNDIKVGDVLEAFTAEKIAADIGTALVDTPAQALTPA